MNPSRIPGGTSTGSKRADALFGSEEGPRRMVRAAGCRVWDEGGREYLDLGMALGAVALGYGHAAVTAAAERAVRDGAVGSLPPVHEEALAERLVEWVPGGEAVRFVKSGAEAVAAAVRIARVVTGRDVVFTCGYHGWLDWCQETAGVPSGIRALHRPIGFGDVGDFVAALREHPQPAAIVVEPVIERAPEPGWLGGLRASASQRGALLIFDEIKTGIRFGPGGAAGRYEVTPDLVVLGKALGNGFPIAAVVGPAALMEAATKTWISSTLATEYVALAAGLAVLETCWRERVPERLASAGARLMEGCRIVQRSHPEVVTEVAGVPELSFLRFRDDATSARVAAAAARRGLLMRRGPYHFVSLAHDEPALDLALERLADAVAEVAGRC
jgi:glutamate-1-semialdehyde 2,1-aminomutase